MTKDNIVITVLISLIALLIFVIVVTGKSNTVRYQESVSICEQAGGEMEYIQGRSICFRKGVLDTLIIRELTPMMNN